MGADLRGNTVADNQITLPERTGKEVATHIETMYPDTVTATTPNMLLSVRNKVFNEIIAALDVIDEEEIRMRLDRRRRFRRKVRAAYRNIREPAHAD